MSAVQGSWSDTPLWTAAGGRDRAAVFTTWGRGRLPVTGGIDVRLAYRLPGKPDGYAPLQRPL